MSNDPLMLSALPKVSGGELKQLQKRCMQLMQQDDEPTKFPGAQPVSFERRHLAPQEPGGRHQPSLVADPYFAAEKTDGVRYMLLILGAKGSFTVDRNFEMRRLPPMRFPSRRDPAAPLDNTLLDGELIADRGGTGQLIPDKKRKLEEDQEEDVIPEPNARRMRFLVYDACRVAGKACCDEPLRERLMAVRRDVLSPRYQLSGSAAGVGAFEGETFTVELKDFFDLPALPHIFGHVQVAPPDSTDGMLYAFHDPLRKLSHGNDGIIFTPARDPYRPYTCPALLKWKPANMNSVDFKLQTKWRREEGVPRPTARFFLCCATQGIIEPFCWITFSEADYARFSSDPLSDSRIIECVFDPAWHTVEYNPNDNEEQTWDHPRRTPGGWRYERIREDKLLPNDKNTVSSILSSVRDGVTATELLQRLRIQASNLGAFAPPPQQLQPPQPAAGPPPPAAAAPREEELN